MVRLSDAGWFVPKIAAHFGVHHQTVRYWIKAYLAGGFDALDDRPHTGQHSAIEPIWNDVKYHEMSERSFADVLQLRSAARAALDRKASKLLAATKRSTESLRAAA